MATFDIELTEVLSRLVKVEARSEIEALDIVNKRYRDGDLILTPDDFQDVTITIVNP